MVRRCSSGCARRAKARARLTPGGGLWLAPFYFRGASWGCGYWWRFWGGMAHFQRLMWFVVGLCLGGLPMLAFADSYSPGWRFSYTGVAPWTESASEVCIAKYAGSSKQIGTGDYLFTEPTSALQQVATGDCAWSYRTTGGLYWQQGSLKASRECWFGGTYQSGMCVDAPPCDQGSVRDEETGQCVPMECPQGQMKNPFTGDCQEPCPTAGTRSGRLHSQSGNPICQFGCLMTRGASPGGSSCVLSLDMGTSGGSTLICDYGYTGVCAVGWGKWRARTSRTYRNRLGRMNRHRLFRRLNRSLRSRRAVRRVFSRRRLTALPFA